MTGKEFRKALKEQFKKLDLDDKEISINSISSFLDVYEGNRTKMIDEAYKSGKTIVDIIAMKPKEYHFGLEDGDDASTMYVEVEQRI